MNLKEGDRVRVLSREVSEDDKKNRRYYAHMAGLSGTVQNIYGADEVAVRIDEASLSKVSTEVHNEATARMRSKLSESISEVQRKELTKEELEFNTHFMLLFNSQDLEKL